MTEERRQKLLQSSQGPGAEPFSQYNHMKVTAVDDGTATVELELQPDSLNCWGTPPRRRAVHHGRRGGGDSPC